LSGQPVPGKLPWGAPVVALVLVNGRAPVTEPHEIAPAQTSFSGGVLVTLKTLLPEAVWPVPSALVMVTVREPMAAPGAMTNDRPEMMVPLPETVGVPVTVIPPPETVTWLAMVTPARLMPLIVTGTVAPAWPVEGETVETLLTAP